MERYVLQVQPWIRCLILRVQERFPGLKRSVEHNTSQEFELFTSESGRGIDSVIQAHSIDP